MNSICILLLLSLASAQLADGSRAQCIPDDDYSELERSLHKWPHNLENLSLAFFPINRQASVYVKVIYSFNGTEESLQYRWSDTSITMLIPTDLLKYLSLFMYDVEPRNVTITLDPLCNFNNIKRYVTSYSTNDHHCRNVSPGLTLLNELTTKVS